MSAITVLWVVNIVLFFFICLVLILHWRREQKTKKAISHLRLYIRKNMQEGVPRPIVAHKLRNAGWREDVVHYETLAAEHEKKQ